MGLCHRTGSGRLPGSCNDLDRYGETQEKNLSERSRTLLETILQPICKLRATIWAEQLINEFGSLPATLRVSAEQLVAVLKNAEAARHLSAIQQTLESALRQEVLAKPVISSSRALADYLRLMLAGEKTEQLRGLYLDSRNSLVGDLLLAKGSIDEVPMSPREIVRCALSLGATSIILVHNHPSGNPTPSQADVEGSRRVTEAAALFDIDLHDHLIVGANACVSLAAHGLLKPR